ERRTRRWRASTALRAVASPIPLEAPVMRKTPSAICRHQGARELAGIEGLQVVQRLAHADELDRQADLVRDRDGDPTLRAAVELRKGYSGDLHRVAEEARLLEPVLARGRVDDEKCLVGRAVEPLGDSAH